MAKKIRDDLIATTHTSSGDVEHGGGGRHGATSPKQGSGQQNLNNLILKYGLQTGNLPVNGGTPLYTGSMPNDNATPIVDPLPLNNTNFELLGNSPYLDAIYNPKGSHASFPDAITTEPAGSPKLADEYTAPVAAADEEKPDSLSDLWTKRMEEIYNQLYNLPQVPRMGDFVGPEFSYDYRDDPSYQQYRQQYIRNGQLAMQDTMGQAAGLTGGYGSSYSQSVGQQAYQGYMNQLNAVVPELYQNAYNRYLNDYSNQYREFTDKYDADLNAYKAEISKLGSLWDTASAMQTRQDKLDSAAVGTDQDYNALASLYKAGLWFDENGNIVPIDTNTDSGLTLEQKMKLRDRGEMLDENGNLVQDYNNIDGMSLDNIRDVVARIKANNKNSKKALEALRSYGLTDTQLMYAMEIFEDDSLT